MKVVIGITLIGALIFGILTMAYGLFNPDLMEQQARIEASRASAIRAQAAADAAIAQSRAAEHVAGSTASVATTALAAQTVIVVLVVLVVFALIALFVILILRREVAALLAYDQVVYRALPYQNAVANRHPYLPSNSYYELPDDTLRPHRSVVKTTHGGH